MLSRTHLIISLVLGAILMLSAVTDLVLAGSTLAQHLQVASPSGQNVGEVAQRIATQLRGG